MRGHKEIYRYRTNDHDADSGEHELVPKCSMGRPVESEIQRDGRRGKEDSQKQGLHGEAYEVKPSARVEDHEVRMRIVSAPVRCPYIQPYNVGGADAAGRNPEP